LLSYEFFLSQNKPKSMLAGASPQTPLYSASADPLAGFKGAASQQKGNYIMEGRTRGREGKGKWEREGKMGRRRPQCLLRSLSNAVKVIKK